jgi:hypothetical protein
MLASFVALGVAGGGCKKEEESKGGDTKSSSTPGDEKGGETKTADAKSPAPGGAVSPGGGVAPADTPLVPADKLARGEALAHVLLPNPSGFLGEIKTQAAPGQAAAFLDEATLKNLAGMQLGSRSNVAKNIDLTKPAGCVLIDATVTMVPIACMVGYTGGAAALVGDLGNDGKEADAAGHVARYKVGGQELFVDELAGAVVVSNHADVFAKSKGYIESNMIGRAKAVASDIEVVAYAGGIMKRYQKELEPVLKAFETPPAPGLAKPLEPFVKWQQKNTKDTIGRLGEMDQMTIALGLEPVGFVARWAVFPTEGSRLQAESQAAAGGACDPEAIKQLPASSWLVAAMATRWDAFKTPSLQEMRKAMTQGYAEAVGKDPAAVDAAVAAFVEESAQLYTGKSAMAVVHLPDTVGALEVASELQSGKSGRDLWKAWSIGFTPEGVLGPEGSKWVTWTFQADAATLAGTPVDRWTIEPTPAGIEKMRKEGGEKLAMVEKKMGGLKLVIDRAEVGGKAVFVLAPGASDKYTQAAIDAINGTGAIGDDPAIGAILARNPGVSSVFAIDARRLLDWVRAIMPPEEAAKIPPGLGNDHGDFFLASSYAANGSQNGELVFSQKLIDQIRALAN